MLVKFKKKHFCKIFMEFIKKTYSNNFRIKRMIIT